MHRSFGNEASRIPGEEWATKHHILENSASIFFGNIQQVAGVKPHPRNWQPCASCHCCCWVQGEKICNLQCCWIYPPAYAALKWVEFFALQYVGSQQAVRTLHLQQTSLFDPYYGYIMCNPLWKHTGNVGSGHDTPRRLATHAGEVVPMNLLSKLADTDCGGSWSRV